MTLADALAAQHDAQAAYTAQLAEFAADQPDLERISALGSAADTALARMPVAPNDLDAIARQRLLDEAQRTADLLAKAHAAALAHIARLADELARSERANDALRAYLPTTTQAPARYLDERR